MIYLLPISHTPAIDSQLNTLKRSSENRSTDPYCLKAYFLKMSHKPSEKILVLQKVNCQLK